MTVEKKIKERKRVSSRVRIKLLPCPFCGGEASYHALWGDNVYIQCNECLFETPNYASKALVAEFWNRRTTVNEKKEAISE